MKRLLLSAAAILLVWPATAIAGTGHGIVLTAASKSHQIQVVDPDRVVHAYSLAGHHVALSAGSVISYGLEGTSITDIRVTGHARKVSYYASVVRTAGKRVVLRLGDGRTLRLAASGTGSSRRPKVSSGREVLAHTASAPVTINIQGLAPGATVLVTETVGAGGSITISISLPTISTGTGSSSGSGSGAGARGSGSGSGSGAGGGSGSGGPIIQGVVTEVDTATFDVQSAGGSAMVFHVDPSVLNNIGMAVCDTVFVEYQSAGGELVADNVDDYGSSDLGDCSGGDGTSDEVGPVTQISDDSVTIDTADQGPLTFAVDPGSALTDGFDLGDDVDVTYALDPDGVTLDATDIEYVETDQVGVVTSVSTGTMTVTDCVTAHTDAFSADPAQDMFDGVQVGDEVDVTSHQSGGQVVVDNVDDLTDDGTWNG